MLHPYIPTARRSISKWGLDLKKATAPIPFAGSLLDETRHVCAFFNSDDEEYRVLLPFMRDGFECGHKESRVNEVWRRHEDAVICTYHLGKFRGDAVIDIVIGGILQQNPFFVPPEEFLHDFHQRRSRRSGQPAA